MGLMAFLSAVLALLLAPGPTNTLMGLAGAQRGLRPMLWLIPAELIGYLTTILLLVFLGAEVLADWPQAASLLKLAAAGWVMLLALRLWQMPGQGARAPDVTFRAVLVTTLLNPKALIFGLVLLPLPTAEGFVPRLALFCLAVIGVALVWGTAGSLTRIGKAAGAGHAGHLSVLQRLASVWLAVVSLTLVAGVLRG